MFSECCKNCPFYSEDYNSLKQGDAIIVGEKIKQFCFMYENGIPDKILKNKEKCKYNELVNSMSVQ